jgi:hypothetical protein
MILLRQQVGPLVVAIGFAVGRTLGDAEAWFPLSWPSPLTLSLLAGLLLAFALRPVMTRLPWSRPTGALLGLALLVCLGPAADWPLHWLLDALGLQTLPPGSAHAAGFELAGALVAAMLIGLVYAQPIGGITPANLWARLGVRGRGYWLGRLAVLAALAVLVRLLVGWLDAAWWMGADTARAPLLAPNGWALLHMAWAGGSGPVALLLGGLWLRALVTFLPLLAIPLVLRAKVSQYLMVFAILLFVLGEFAPLMLDQPYFSGTWLGLRVAMGLLVSIVLGGAMAWAFRDRSLSVRA